MFEMAPRTCGSRDGRLVMLSRDRHRCQCGCQDVRRPVRAERNRAELDVYFVVDSLEVSLEKAQALDSSVSAPPM